jgi:hypothetical protein
LKIKRRFVQGVLFFGEIDGIDFLQEHGPQRTIHAGFQPVWPARRMDSACWAGHHFIF